MKNGLNEPFTGDVSQWAIDCGDIAWCNQFFVLMPLLLIWPLLIVNSDSPQLSPYSFYEDGCGAYVW